MKLATKPVTRRVAASVFSAGFRNVIVTVQPDGVIALRLHGQRRVEYVFADTVYKEAVVARHRYERFLKRKGKKGKK